MKYFIHNIEESPLFSLCHNQSSFYDSSRLNLTDDEFLYQFPLCIDKSFASSGRPPQFIAYLIFDHKLNIVSQMIKSSIIILDDIFRFDSFFNSFFSLELTGFIATHRPELLIYLLVFQTTYFDEIWLNTPVIEGERFHKLFVQLPVNSQTALSNYLFSLLNHFHPSKMEMAPCILRSSYVSFFLNAMFSITTDDNLHLLLLLFSEFDDDTTQTCLNRLYQLYFLNNFSEQDPFRDFLSRCMTSPHLTASAFKSNITSLLQFSNVEHVKLTNPELFF